MHIGARTYANKLFIVRRSLLVSRKNLRKATISFDFDFDFSSICAWWHPSSAQVCTTQSRMRGVTYRRLQFALKDFFYFCILIVEHASMGLAYQALVLHNLFESNKVANTKMIMFSTTFFCSNAMVQMAFL